MTVEILGPDATPEHANAEKLRSILIDSAPDLKHRDVRLAIIPQVFVNNREIDCVLVFEDRRVPKDRFFTVNGVQIQNFVACVEIKKHSSDAVRYHGTRLEVQYDSKWHDATAQVESQVWALKDFQDFSYRGKHHRQKTYVQSIIWFLRVPRGSLDTTLHRARTNILYADLNWHELINGFEGNQRQGGRLTTLIPARSTVSFLKLGFHHVELVRTFLPQRLMRVIGVANMKHGIFGRL